MPIASADIRPGKCFLSQADRLQVVRVLAVEGGLLRFEVKARRAA